VNDGKVSSATFSRPKVVAPRDLLRFMSAKHVHGNWSMKFVAVAYSNCSRSVKKEYLGAPAPLARALKGVSLPAMLYCIHSTRQPSHLLSLPTTDASFCLSFILQLMKSFCLKTCPKISS
jgi:hypothetical protein